MKLFVVAKQFALLLLMIFLLTPGIIPRPSNVSHILSSPSVTPDFTMVANPASQTIQSGATGTSTVTLTSLNGFAGSVTVTATPPPMCPSPYCGSWWVSPNSVSLVSGGTAKAILSFTGGTIGNPRTWNVTVFGTSGALSHNVTISFTVVPVSATPDFLIAANPSSLAIVQGSAAKSTIILTSVQGFQGTESLASSVGCPTASLSCPLATLYPSSVSLAPNGTATAILTVSTAKSTSAATYPVVVTGTVGSLSHSVTVSVKVVQHLDGDVDYDCKVDITDLAMVAGVYGSTAGAPRWNPPSDLNGDGRIDILDIVIVAGNYGRSC